MNVSCYLSFNGDCREAFAFYAKVFNAKIIAMIAHGETPAKDHMPPEAHASIIHARLDLGGGLLMGADTPPSMRGDSKMQGFSVNLGTATVAETDRVFAELSKGGKIIMPVAETFWSKRFGMCVDRFGTPWMVNCELPV